MKPEETRGVASRLDVADAFVAACVALVAVLALLPERWLVDAFVIDDAFYYPRIAMNLVAGRGLTYDGRVWTNGFHPLWEALLVPLAAVSGGDPARMMRLSFVLSAALVAASVVGLRDLARSLGWGVAGVVTTVGVLVFARVDLWMSLMESGASLFFLVVALAAMVRWDLLASDRPAHVVGTGVLLAAVFLVRLDFVFLCAAWLVTGVVVRRVGGRGLVDAVRGPFASGVVLTLCAAPYLVANRVAFGSIVPVSGRRKQVMADSIEDVWRAAVAPFRTVGRKLDLPAEVVMALAVVVLVVGVLGTRGRAGPRFDRGGAVVGFVAGVVVRFLYLRAFFAAESALVPWYWVPETLLVGLVAGFLASRAVAAWGPSLPLALRGRAAAGLSVAAFFAGGVAYLARDADAGEADDRAHQDAAEWVGARVTPETRCAMYDSGRFSWYSRCDTVGLNGLIGDDVAMELVLEHRYTDLMRLHGTEYLAFWADPPSYAAVPADALLFESAHAPASGAKAGQRLVVIDARRYTPFTGGSVCELCP